MPNRIVTLAADDIEDFQFVVLRSGRLPENFELYERQSMSLPEGSIRASYGLLDLTYKPTGIRQSYQFGHNNPGEASWQMLLAKDLAVGLFDGRPATHLNAELPELQMLG